MCENFEQQLCGECTRDSHGRICIKTKPVSVRVSDNIRTLFAIWMGGWKPNNTVGGLTLTLKIYSLTINAGRVDEVERWDRIVSWSKAAKSRIGRSDFPAKWVARNGNSSSPCVLFRCLLHAFPLWDWQVSNIVRSVELDERYTTYNTYWVLWN